MEIQFRELSIILLIKKKKNYLSQLLNAEIFFLEKNTENKSIFTITRVAILKCFFVIVF